MNLKRFCCTTYAFAGCFLWTAAYLLVALLPFTILKLMGREPRSVAFIARYGRLISRVGVWPVMRVRFEDMAPEERRPGIYICNHRSGSDPFLAALLATPQIQIVNGWPMRLFFFGFFARLNGFIDSTAVDYEQLRALVKQKLDLGISVTAFPEGTRSGSRKMNPFHSGIFKVALDLQVPVYPCCIVGNEELPDRKFRFSSGRVRVRRLPPMPPEAMKAKTPYVLKKQVWNRINEECIAMEGNEA